MILSVLALGAAVVAYAVATLALSSAAQATSEGGRALAHVSWWTGTALQGLGFLFAFGARHDLPLLLVQPILTTSLAVTALLGAATGRWVLGRRDYVCMLAVVVGVSLLGVAARTGPSQELTAAGLSVLYVVLALALGGALRPVGAPKSARRALWLGGCAGLAFGASAVAARALAADPIHAVQTGWGWGAVGVVVAGALIGQLSLTGSLTAGHVGGPVAVMYAVETAGPALAGVVWLGDNVADNLVPFAVVGALAALAGSIGLRHHGSEQPERVAAG